MGRSSTSTGPLPSTLPGRRSALVALAGVLGLLAVVLRRRGADRRCRRRAGSAACLVLAAPLCLSLVTVGRLFAPHHVRWLWVVGVFVQVVALWAVVELVVAPMAAAGHGGRRRARSCSTVGARRSAALPFHAQQQGPVSDYEAMPALRRVFRDLEPLRVERAGRLRHRPTSGSSSRTAAPIMMRLQELGIEFRTTDEAMVRQLGDGRRADGTERTRVFQLEGRVRDRRTPATPAAIGIGQRARPGRRRQGAARPSTRSPPASSTGRSPSTSTRSRPSCADVARCRRRPATRRAARWLVARRHGRRRRARRRRRPGSAGSALVRQWVGSTIAVFADDPRQLSERLTAPAKATIAERHGGEQPEAVQPLEADRPAGVGQRALGAHDVGDDGADRDEDAERDEAGQPGPAEADDEHGARRRRRRAPSRGRRAGRRRRPTRRWRSSGGASGPVGSRHGEAGRARPTAPVTGAGRARPGRRTPAPRARSRTRAIVSGRWAVQRIATSTGPDDGGIHHPLKPPSTSCGGAEIAIVGRRRPRVVEALAEHEPAAVGAAVDRDVAARAALRAVTVAVGPRTGCGDRAVRRGEHDPVDVETGAGAGRRGDAVDAGVEVERSAVAARVASSGVAGERRRRPSPLTRTGNGLAVDREQVVAAAGVERRRHRRRGRRPRAR